MSDKLIESIHYGDRTGLYKVIQTLEKILPEPGVNVTYLCIGSDLSTGDCFGPLTGTLLHRLGVPGVTGTLDQTVHAKNLVEKISQIPPDDYIVAVDATLGRIGDVGRLSFINAPLRPGAAMKKDLPPVGHISVVFNAAPAGFANFLVLGCASLNKVWQGANLLARGIGVVSFRRKKTLTTRTGDGLLS
ncbi:MAG: spore protease YyaC [Firmicutes bacterium]|nr:spore protease YyaC [Bacillota bacterium]